MSPLEESGHKQLGQFVTFTDSNKEKFDFVKEKLQSKLSNVTEKAMVPGEFKLAVYEHYILPSVRYFLTVHNLLKTDLEVLDTITRAHIKLWIGIPKFGATALAITHPSGLGVGMPS